MPGKILLQGRRHRADQIGLAPSPGSPHGAKRAALNGPPPTKAARDRLSTERPASADACEWLAHCSGRGEHHASHQHVTQAFSHALVARAQMTGATFPVEGGDMSEAPPGLAALEARLRHDLACLNYPPANWVPRAPRNGTSRCSTSCVIGGGMCGLVGGLRAACGAASATSASSIAARPASKARG